MTMLRHALRALARTPFVTLVAVVSLAFGIGANAAIFSLFEELLLRPPPVEAPVIALAGATRSSAIQCSATSNGPTPASLV